MSDNSFDFDDSFDDLLSQTVIPNEDIFSKLFSNHFEDESILTELSTNESLPQIILDFENYCNRDNRSNDLFFDYILGLNNLMQKLSQIEDEVIELWISSPKQTQNCILSTIFKFLPNCYSQLCEPKAVDLSKFAKNIRISFYESIAFNICQLMITLTANHFESVEQLLIKELLSEQSICHLLASDVLCFMARVAKSPLCYHLCSVLMTISSYINDSQLPNITSFINRLIPFLKDIELEYLLKDYDLLNYSRVWRIPNIFRVLSSQQIKDNFVTFMTHIENGKPLTKYNINVLSHLLMTEELDEKSRQNCFELFWKNFLTLNDYNLYSDFIQILTVLLPNQLNDSFVRKTFVKLNKIFESMKENNSIALNFAFIQNVLQFSVRLSICDASDQTMELMTTIISSYICFFYKNCNNYYIKYSVFKALNEISLKSKLITIVDKCCKDANLREEFVLYLQTLKTIQVMDENEKIDYLQTIIESNLRNQNDFKTNEVVVEYNHMNGKVCVENNGFDHLITKEVYSKDRIQELIDGIAQNVRHLKENKSLIKCNHKRGLSSLLSDFKELI